MVQLAVRAVPRHARRAVQTDDGCAQRRGEMQRPAVARNYETRPRKQRGELAEIGIGNEGGSGYGCNPCRALMLPGTPDHRDARASSKKVPRDRNEPLLRPELSRLPRAGMQQYRAAKLDEAPLRIAWKRRKRREVGGTAGGARGEGERAVLIDDVHRRVDRDPSIEKRKSERFADRVPVEAETFGGPRSARDRRRLDQPLKIESDRPAPVLPQIAQKPPRRGPRRRRLKKARPSPRPGDNDGIDGRTKLDDLAVRGFDHPRELRVGKSTAQRHDSGNGVNDVSERREPDDEQPPGPDGGHGFDPTRTREIRSVVEWSFGSPTITTRPPTFATIAASGTLSAV